ncbi:acyl-CoA dehydrogenase family protein [Salsipaludibacter albus]|uniref:acyl-CoA dehydrogenase family protein n=1 Tax=Salsipaludibacter albus TaxID=2849650 RepID=UPI001EE47DC2|nr:acyl-CoA dehydrogenase family protein [Salsipaludibacter albus]MBY5161990.1 acyl-CoA dehydrogenase family protein [Salsipaludibacter albus]
MDHDDIAVRERLDEAVDRLVAEHPPASTSSEEFWGAQYDAGLAWVHHPEGKGGLGVSPRWLPHVRERLHAAGADQDNIRMNIIGIGMGAGTLVAHAPESMQDRMLRPMFTMEEIWCQLFSEPGAGSDLANLSTSAVPEGDQWVVNGQKVWTTLAHISRWGMLVTRTDPSAPKHRGLTYFILDMEAPGVEVRPLHQITAEAEFNEVYLDDVHVDDDMRLGEVGGGWSVSMTTLMNERVAIGGGVPPRGSGSIATALQVWEERGHDDPVLRDRLTELWIEAEALRLTSQRAADARTAGTPGPEGSTSKLHWAELNKDLTSFTMELLEGDGMLYPGGYELHAPTSRAERESTPQKAFLRARANSIEGGTSQIMKNILGERVLGLPGEPRVDKDLPWKDVAR